jgi:hypothetical protein
MGDFIIPDDKNVPEVPCMWYFQGDASLNGSMNGMINAVFISKTEMFKQVGGKKFQLAGFAASSSGAEASGSCKNISCEGCRSSPWGIGNSTSAGSYAVDHLPAAA